MRKRFLAMVLSLAMVAALATAAASPAHAATNNEALAAAEELHRLGLFQGVGNNADGSINYDLNRAMSREEGVTMLVRLLGMEDEAKKGTWKAPFTDVSEWAKPYVNYAYTNELTNGIGNNQYGGGTGYTMSATQYLTFCLRSMGYESGKDFQWDSAWTLTDKLGITNKQYNAGNNTKFTRGDAAIVSLATYRSTMLRIYGLPADAKLIENPKDKASYVMNFAYNMAIGHYDDWIPGDMRDTGMYFAIVMGDFQEFFPELFGGLVWYGGQGDYMQIAQYEGTYRFFLEKGSLKSVWDQSNEAIKVARKIQSELHASGAIRDGMTKREIEYEYFKYMREKYVPEIEYVMENVNSGSTAYACLVEKKCNSIGRAAAWNILMHLEGIPSMGIGLNDHSHASLMRIDGVNWICDFGDKGGSLFSSDYDHRAVCFREMEQDLWRDFLTVREEEGYQHLLHFVNNPNHRHLFVWLMRNGDTMMWDTELLKDNDSFSLDIASGNLKVEYVGDCLIKYTPTDGSKITVTDPKKFTISQGDSAHPASPHFLDNECFIKDGSLYTINKGFYCDPIHVKTGFKRQSFDLTITNGTDTWTCHYPGDGTAKK